MDYGVSVLGRDVNESLVLLVMTDIVEEVEIYNNLVNYPGKIGSTHYTCCR